MSLLEVNFCVYAPSLSEMTVSRSPNSQQALVRLQCICICRLQHDADTASSGPQPAVQLTSDSQGQGAAAVSHTRVQLPRLLVFADRAAISCLARIAAQMPQQPAPQQSAPLAAAPPGRPPRSNIWTVLLAQYLIRLRMPCSPRDLCRIAALTAR